MSGKRTCTGWRDSCHGDPEIDECLCKAEQDREYRTSAAADATRRMTKKKAPRESNAGAVTPKEEASMQGESIAWL